MLLTTTTTYDASQYEVIGVVDGLVTRSISDFRQFFASLTGIFGGKNDLLNTKFLQARDQALEQLSKKASALGADMVVGVSLTTDAVVVGGQEFITYGALGTALRRRGEKPVSAGKRKTFRAKRI